MVFQNIHVKLILTFLMQHKERKGKKELQLYRRLILESNRSRQYSNDNQRQSNQERRRQRMSFVKNTIYSPQIRVQTHYPACILA